MSIPEAFKGAAIEWSRLPSTTARVKYVARTSRLFLEVGIVLYHCKYYGRSELGAMHMFRMVRMRGASASTAGLRYLAHLQASLAAQKFAAKD